MYQAMIGVGRAARDNCDRLLMATAAVKESRRTRPKGVKNRPCIVPIRYLCEALIV